MSPILIRDDWNKNEPQHQFLDVEDALFHIQEHPSYEIIGDGAVRPYGDLDCKVFQGTEEEFWLEDKKLISLFTETLQGITVTTASAYPKLSLRWYVSDCYVESRHHAKEFAKQLYAKLELPVQIIPDYSVYSSYKKMRTFYTSKPKENRPFQMVQGKVIDTLITYIPDSLKQFKVELPEVKPSDPQAVKSNVLLLKVIDALPIKFIESYNDWITIGMVLFNEGFAIEDWDSVSKRSSNYDGNIKTHWDSFKQVSRGVTGATLWKWLKDTNRIEFWTLMEERPDFWNMIALLNNNGTARYFYNIHPNAYLFNEILGWYSLSASNVWKHYEKAQPNGIKRHIADTLQELAMDTKKAELLNYEKQSANEKCKKKQEEITAQHAEKIKLIHSAYIKFGSSEFCNGVLSFLPSFYNDDLLEDKMDKNTQLFAFTNGVYDLMSMQFRPILSTDYISVTTGYNYNNTSNSKIRKEIGAFLFSLFENDESVNYLLSVLASCLFGSNRFQEFYVFTGSGGNGKSLITLLLKAVFGGYYLSVDSSLITKPVERRDQPVPALVEARTCRLMLSSEPEASDKLQVGLLKKMSGGDMIEARTLHSKHIVKYVAMFKFFILANDIPALNKIDGGIQRRMKVLKFPFAFKRQSEIVAPFHRLANPDLERNMMSELWRDEMVLMLIEKYAEVRFLKASPTCPAVEEQSKEYLDENNPLKSWLNEYYTLGGDGTIAPRELKQQYLLDTRVEGIDDKKFKQLLGFNGVHQKKSNGIMKYIGLTRKEENIEN